MMMTARERIAVETRAGHASLARCFALIADVGRVCRRLRRPMSGRAVPASVEPSSPAPPLCPRWDGFYVGGQVGWASPGIEFRRRHAVAGRARAARARTISENQVSALEGARQADTRSASSAASSATTMLGTAHDASASTSPGVKVNSGVDSGHADQPRVPLPADDLRLRDDPDRRRAHAHHRFRRAAGARRLAARQCACRMRASASRSAAGDIARTARGHAERNPDDASSALRRVVVHRERDKSQRRSIYGWSLSGGLDIMLMPNLFMRAEYEFVNFPPTSRVSTRSISTGRLGVGYKF